MSKLRHRLPLALLVLAMTTTPAHGREVPVSLRGSQSSMERQNEVARESQYTFLETPQQVQEYVQKGLLVPVGGNADYELARGVSFPYARPETLQFLELFASRHRQACGKPLVVTSVTRPATKQPGNAHALSVHPTGMAVDLRVDRDGECRKWLEFNLLALEADGILDVTRERHPPHFHVAVFPDAFRAYAEKQPDEKPPVEALGTDATPPAGEVEGAGETGPAAASPAPAGRAQAGRARRGGPGEEIALGLGLAAALGLGAVLYRRSRRDRGRHDDDFRDGGDLTPRHV